MGKKLITLKKNYVSPEMAAAFGEIKVPENEVDNYIKKRNYIVVGEEEIAEDPEAVEPETAKDTEEVAGPVPVEDEEEVPGPEPEAAPKKGKGKGKGRGAGKSK